eukprot:4390603-Amphidinium_carterae.1
MAAFTEMHDTPSPPPSQLQGTWKINMRDSTSEKDFIHKGLTNLQGPAGQQERPSGGRACWRTFFGYCFLLLEEPVANQLIVSNALGLGNGDVVPEAKFDRRCPSALTKTYIENEIGQTVRQHSQRSTKPLQSTS